MRKKTTGNLSLEFDRITSQIPIILWTTDRELNFTSVSGGGVGALQASIQTRVPPRSIFDLFQSQDPNLPPIRSHNRALDGESVAYEYELACRTYDTHLEPLRKDGEITGVTGVAIDITDQKRAMRYRETQFATTRILAESVTLHEAIVHLLEAICHGVDWDFARMWRREEASKRLLLEAHWQSPDFNTATPIATPRICPGKPCVGCVVSGTGEAMWVTDVTEEESSGPEIIDAGLRSCFAVPVQHAHQTVGVMEFFSRSIRYPDFELLKAMTDIGSQIGLFIERKKVEEERERSEKLQSALYRIASLASAATDLNEFYKSIHDTVAELMEARNFYIAVLSEDGERIEAPYFVDEEDEQVPPPAAWRGGLTEYVLQTGNPLLADPEKFARMVAEGKVVSRGAPSLDWLGVPLKAGEKTFGVLVVQSYSEKSRFGKKEAEILMFVSQQVAGAILQRRSQEALRRSEERYRSQVQCAVYGLYRSTIHGKFLDVNPALVQMLGYSSPEELYAMDMAIDLYANSEQRQILVSEFAHSQRIEGVETRWKRKDGKIITVRLSGRAGLKYPGEPESFEMIAEDITERRMLEEQLLHSQKMEAVGRLAGGVAHDFNNLLTVIKGYSELMLNEVTEKDPMRVEVEEIRRAAERAASLTRQLLAFSRRQVLEPKVLDLNTIIRNMQRLLQRLLSEDVQLQVSLPPDLGHVKADPGQIEQVIMNLAVNARDAMPQGGKLTIETGNHVIDETYAREHAVVHAGRYAMMAVTDTGIGMDQQTVSHIFEPFFTTKETGKGTGLGLSTVYGIVKQSGGYIWVYSEPGRGTTFKVYLPVVETGKPDDMGMRPVLAPTYRGTETILLVEDEDGVRALVREVLQRHGYHVIETRNGGEALLACEQHSGNIHLLLSDVVLAQVTGTELARRLTPLRPEMKVLFISGYTEEAIIHQGMLEEGTAFLQKPFTPNVLARKVREVLDGKIQ
jgi:PAS domain S-box-containing protein